ncbi:hypothetical protein J6590_063541 [Homalodisca vitripennis]|nr:hypothetical protein J6590_063541 [Homalodisca vitripennis]
MFRKRHLHRRTHAIRDDHRAVVPGVAHVCGPLTCEVQHGLRHANQLIYRSVNCQLTTETTRPLVGSRWWHETHGALQTTAVAVALQSSNVFLANLSLRARAGYTRGILGPTLHPGSLQQPLMASRRPGYLYSGVFEVHGRRTKTRQRESMHVRAHFKAGAICHIVKYVIKCR